MLSKSVLTRQPLRTQPLTTAGQHPLVDDAGDSYRDRLDTVRGFVAEACVITPDAWVAKSALYKAYRAWAKGSGRLPVSAATFNDHLARNHAGELEIRRRRGYDGWIGLGLLADPNEEERR